jgi:hypothetical protein
MGEPIVTEVFPDDGGDLLRDALADARSFPTGAVLLTDRRS